MINFEFDRKCYGCSACANVCPQKAIEMVHNDEGFLVPKVNKKKCIDCGLCNKVCIYLNQKDHNEVKKNDIILSAYRKNPQYYKNYTSSGIFHEAAKIFIENQGIVCGCVWNSKMEAEHILATNMEVVAKMSYSKYVQSNLNDCFEKIEQELKNGKKILFSGTPCQVGAIKRYLKNEYSNFYAIAIVCHGVPSPKIWEKYKEELEKKYSSKMVDANFRYKGKYGWITPFTKYTFENKKESINLSFTEDKYVIAFGADILHRNTCYDCRYKGTNSNADIVIGDYWGCSTKLLKKSKNKGINSVIVHTEKGKELMEKIENLFEFNNEKLESISLENKPIIQPVKYNNIREDFYEEYIKNGDIKRLDTMFNRKKYKIKRILYKFYIFELLKRFKYYIKH